MKMSNQGKDKKFAREVAFWSVVGILALIVLIKILTYV